MGILFQHRPRLWAPLWAFGAIAIAATGVYADEIRLKDGKKLYGVIVSYEENMFKVKTDFGFVLVEKDKIASIIPSAPASTDAHPSAKNAAEPAKTGTNAQPKAENASALPSDVKPTNTADKTASKINGGAVKPESAANVPAAQPVAPALKGSGDVANPAIPVVTAQPAAPKEPEVPAIREDVQGNLYTNYTHGFRMYKAPSWQLIEGARSALPNAIVAMGTSNESSLMVVGREKAKEPLDIAAVTVERRLHEVYDNYQRVSQRKTTVGGSPAMEFYYRGKADDHDWSGTLVVISRNGDIFTVLGMTYADNDLIQIQENVIARAIASLSFDLPEAKK